MAKFEIIMPKLGESIIEATITRWMKSAGDLIEEDESIAEIATDKVDSEIPSPVEGKLIELLFQEGDVVAVGKPIAVIEIEGDEAPAADDQGQQEPETADQGQQETKANRGGDAPSAAIAKKETAVAKASPGRFYSPLVRNIATKENISIKELDGITGSGKDGRVTKQDILEHLAKRPASGAVKGAQSPSYDRPGVVAESGDEIFEMDRMRQLIADHMVMSKQVSPHVTSFIDVDVSRIVRWREKVKEAFYAREKGKLTYTHIFIEAAALALKDYPRVNASLDGSSIIHRKKINIGMATALPNGNLIVPVIKDADQKSLLGIVKDVNDLADRSRNNALLPDEIQGGTFTVTNFGSFDSLTGTPIINQPQVAILGIGAIRKKPVVVETAEGDQIAIRNIMILSLAYDHRVVDGALGACT